MDFFYREFIRILEFLRVHREELCRAWEHIHGIA